MNIRVISLAGLFLIATLLFSCGSSGKGRSLGAYYIKKSGGMNIGGTVAYKSKGLKKMVAMRRNKAISLMRKTCGANSYRIIKEEKTLFEKRNEKYLGDTKRLIGQKVLFIDFNCEK